MTETHWDARWRRALALLALATVGCAHARPGPAPASRAPASRVDTVAAAIATRLGTVHHGLGRATAHGHEVLFASGRLSLSVSEPEAQHEHAHVHVLARLTGVPAGAMDSCIVGLGATADASLANAADRYVELAFMPLAALLEPAAHVDAQPFSGDEPYGVAGYRGFVGAVSATQSADGAALSEAALFAGLGPLPADGRVHIAKAVLVAEQGTWWRTLELDAQPTSVAHERWSGAVAPGAPAVAIRFAVFSRPDTLTHDQGRAEASRILDARPAWLRDDGCPAEIMPAALVQYQWSSRACTGGRLLDCVSECESGSPASCYSAAIDVQQARQEDPAVQALFLRACRLGDASACTNAAAGRAMDACSVRTFDQTCAQTGDPWGCAMLGMALAKGEGIARDLERARASLRKACAQASADPACAAATKLLSQIDAAP